MLRYKSSRARLEACVRTESEMMSFSTTESGERVRLWVMRMKEMIEEKEFGCVDQSKN